MNLAYRHAHLVLRRARRSKKGIRAAEKALQRVVHEEMRRDFEAVRRMPWPDRSDGQVLVFRGGESGSAEARVGEIRAAACAGQSAQAVQGGA